MAAVPVHESNTSRQVDFLPSPEDADSVKPKEIATAARVLQVSRNTQVHVIICLASALAKASFEWLGLCEYRLGRGSWCWRAGVESTLKPHPNKSYLATWLSMWNKLGRPRKPGAFLNAKPMYST